MRRSALSIACASFAACAQPATSGPSSRPGTGTMSQMLKQRGVATIVTRDGRGIAVDVEIASNDADRTRGLMFRKAMPEQAGMIFIFPEEEEHSFWMKNTFLPLDMLFIDAPGRVVGIVEQVDPLTTTPRGVRAASNRVLEVNGGFCQRNGVKAGDRVELKGEYRLE
jgi:uncharacterized membrane protein (UPF0127 family)